MSKITFKHGGPTYDNNYPEGIPTSVVLNVGGKNLESGMVMFPSGHSRNTACNLDDILKHKFGLLGRSIKQDER
jgi:2-methylcitrate dehydratase